MRAELGFKKVYDTRDMLVRGWAASKLDHIEVGSQAVALAIPEERVI